MIIAGKLTFLINYDQTTIEIHDESAVMKLLSITLTPDQLSAILSRRGHVPVQIDFTNHLERIGKTHEHDRIEFAINSRDKKYLFDRAKKFCPDGWEVSDTFSSQSTFFERDGQDMARCTIRRWV